MSEAIRINEKVCLDCSNKDFVISTLEFRCTKLKSKIHFCENGFDKCDFFDLRDYGAELEMDVIQEVFTQGQVHAIRSLKDVINMPFSKYDYYKKILKEIESEKENE